MLVVQVRRPRAEEAESRESRDFRLTTQSGGYPRDLPMSKQLCRYEPIANPCPNSAKFLATDGSMHPSVQSRVFPSSTT
jgi:hypothetical protein